MTYFFKNSGENRIKRFSKDNKGSTLVTVLVAFFFLSILVTVVMSTVMINYRMRSIDRTTKDEFYYAEKALNDVYAGIGENCSLAIGEAYSEVMKEYKPSNDTDPTIKGSYQDQVKAYNVFCQRYLSKIYASSGTYGLAMVPLANSGDDLKDKLNSYIVGTKASVVSVGQVVRYNNSRNKAGEKKYTNGDNDIKDYPDIRYTVIKDVKIVTSGTNGYISGLTTDIVIETPQVDFFTVNEKSLDFAVVATEGIEFNGNATIKGSVFGGAKPTANINKKDNAGNFINSIRMTKSSDYGGILVKGSQVKIDGEYIVSGGDIYVDNESTNPGKLYINNATTDQFYSRKSEIWFDNISVVGPDSDLKIKGDLYAMGDLQVEGDGSNVEIAGNYYGYNAGYYHSSSTDNGVMYFSSKTDALTDANGKSTANPSSKSSSIIVNARHANVDMRNVDTFVVLGKAYINHEKGAKDVMAVDDIVLVPGQTNDEEIGESVALKSGQEIFLVPTEFLKGKTNPETFTDTSFSFTVNEDAMKHWFGYKYLDPNELTKSVRLVSNGVYREYLYLNFKKDGGYNKNQNDYIDEVMKGIVTTYVDSNGKTAVMEPSQATLKNRFSKLSYHQDSKITIGKRNPTTNDATGETRIFTNGSIIQYAEHHENVAGSVVTTVDLSTLPTQNGGIDRFGGYGKNMYNKYQNICTYLDPLANRPLSSSTGIPDVNYNDTEYDELPFGKLFWLAGIRNNPTTVVSSDDTVDNYGSTLIVVRTGGGDYFYNPSSAVDLYDIWDSCGSPNNAFIIVDGNAYVDSSMSFNGFLYVKGELDVRSGASLNVNYNSTLLDRRIEKELVALKKAYVTNLQSVPDLSNTNELKKKLRESYKNDTLIYYLLNVPTPGTGNRLTPKVDQLADDKLHGMVKTNPITEIDTYRKYGIDVASREKTDHVNADYNQFMYFENWKKGL